MALGTGSTPPSAAAFPSIISKNAPLVNQTPPARGGRPQMNAPQAQAIFGTPVGRFLVKTDKSVIFVAIVETLWYNKEKMRTVVHRTRTLPNLNGGK